jgi:transcriptional regulator with XRE-family HTH domain
MPLIRDPNWAVASWLRNHETSTKQATIMITKEQKELFRRKVGKLLEQRRLEKGMSRKDLGETLGYEGNSAIQVVARFESGRAGVPKTKISHLLKILDIRNEDFGLGGSKSLKNFISASGFLGSTMAPWSDAMIGFLENTEASFVTQSLSDDENDDESSSADTQGELYQDLLRILRLYRVQKQQHPLSLVEKLDLLDSLSEGNEERLTQMLVTLNVDPHEAYQAIESHLMDQLKGGGGK